MTKEDLEYKIKHHLFVIQQNILLGVSSKGIDIDLINKTDKLLKLRTRDFLFELEGLLRLHIKTNRLSIKQEKSAERILRFLKETEDLIGKLELEKSLKKEKSDFHLVSKKEEKENASLLRKKWENISKIEKEFYSLDLVFKPKDVLILLKKELKRIDTKSRGLSEYIELKKYSYENLELGFHEWRRAIRWISIYIQFYKDYFHLVEDSTKTPYPLLKEFENSAFTQFKEKSNISMNKRRFFELSAYIYYSGKVKEKLEAKILLQTDSFIHYEYSCQQMYKKFNKENILKKLRKSLKISN
jgi:hypothetical protein